LNERSETKPKRGRGAFRENQRSRGTRCHSFWGQSPRSKSDRSGTTVMMGQMRIQSTGNRRKTRERKEEENSSTTGLFSSSKKCQTKKTIACILNCAKEKGEGGGASLDQGRGTEQGRRGGKHLGPRTQACFGKEELGGKKGENTGVGVKELCRKRKLRVRSPTLLNLSLTKRGRVLHEQMTRANQKQKRDGKEDGKTGGRTQRRNNGVTSVLGKGRKVNGDQG